MTLNTAAWAITGAKTDAVLARSASFAESAGAEGVIGRFDLKITPLTTAGAGFQMNPGGALILNRYQTNPRQTYTVFNDGADPLVFGSTVTPPVSANAVSHLVCVTVGDPDFTQAEHPWMLASDPPAGQEETFQYVRVFVIPNVGSQTTSFRQLGKKYPAYALARVDLPAGSTDWSAGTFKDLRSIARPRAVEYVFNAASSSTNGLGNGVNVYENWPSQAVWDVDVPEWATVAKVTGFVEGVKKVATGQGTLQILLEGAGASAATNIDEPAPAGGVDREGWNISGTITVPVEARDLTKKVRIQGKVNNTASKFFLTTDSITGSSIRIRFEETAI